MTGLRRFVIPVLALAALALVSCDTIGASMLQATFPARGDGVTEFHVQPLPVTFWDRTGLVVGIKATEWTQSAEDSALGIHAIPGVPNALSARWMGGACEDHVTVTLLEESDHLALRVDSSMSPLTLGCVALGVFRELRITFRREITPDEVALSQSD